jgi:hypothetical protein
MDKFLDNLKQKQVDGNKKIQDKLKNGEPLTDKEMKMYSLTDDDRQYMALLDSVTSGVEIPGFTFRDFLGTPQAKTLIPQVIIGAMRKSMEPVYLASKFFTKIKMKSGQPVLFPSIGAMRAFDVAEAQEIPQATIDWQMHRSRLIYIVKSGIRIQLTDELLSDSDWDIYGMMITEAGRALARLKEEKAYLEWKKHGWTVFDNDLYGQYAANKTQYAQYAEAGTTGVDYLNNLNNTMSVEDFLDLYIALYNNEYTPTDMVIHPLGWITFAKNGLIGGYSSALDKAVVPESPNASFKLGPESVQGRVPFAFNCNLSPFAPIDKVNKTFDVSILDRNNVGVLIVKDEVTTEEFRDPARDLNNLKMIERYGYGVHNEGRAVCMAKNISMAKSYEQPYRVQNI